MFEDIYYWRKNGRPDVEKDHDRNLFCQYVYQKLKKEGALIKTFHLEPDSEIDQNIFDKNLTAFVKYSLNKKERWDKFNILEHLNHLQNDFPDMEVYVIERVNLVCSPYACHVPFPHYYNYYPIRHLHTLNQNGYSLISVNSALGQPYKSLLSENRMAKQSVTPPTKERSKIAIHYITSPENFLKLKGKNFYSGRGDVKDYRAEKYKKRFKDIEDNAFWRKHGLLEKLDGRVDLRDHSLITDYEDSPREFYNLEEHLVEKWVMVKRRKNSSWSISSG